MNIDDHPVCACCNEHFTGNQETDDFLEWEYCEGRKEWTCSFDCRDDWNEEERCEEEDCVYCCQWNPEHVCKTCERSMSDADFQNGKMCCDKPMFDDDEDEEDKVICHECNKPCEAEEDSDLVLIAMRDNKPICTKCIESK